MNLALNTLQNVKNALDANMRAGMRTYLIDARRSGYVRLSAHFDNSVIDLSYRPEAGWTFGTIADNGETNLYTGLGFFDALSRFVGTMGAVTITTL